jgi:inner membrane protein
LFYDIIATTYYFVTHIVFRNRKKQVILLRYHTHIVTSLAVGACIASQTSLPFTVSYATGVIVGSLLPDIDEPNSYVGRRSLGMSNKVKQAFGHRGMTHSILVWAVITTVLLIQSPSLFSYGLIIGYLLHIIEDFFSVQGVPLFWPFQTKRYKSIITYRTAGLLERVIYYISFGLFVYIAVSRDLFSEFTQSVIVFLQTTIQRLM